MSGLLDGATVPWHIVSGKRDPARPTTLPETVRREPQTMQQRAAEVRRLGASFDQLGTAAKLLAENLRRYR